MTLWPLLALLLIAPDQPAAPPVAAGPTSAEPADAANTIPPTAPVLNGGTAIAMVTTVAISSRQNRLGDRFDLTVTEDVRVAGHVVIPKGARGIGEISRVVPKGAFGKSGKLEIRLLYVDVGAARIRLDGRAGDRGRSGTGATVVTAVLAGVFSAFVTGTSAELPAGTALTGYVERDVPLVWTAPPPAQQPHQAPGAGRADTGRSAATAP